MPDPGAIRAAKAYVELGTESQQLNAGLRDAEQRIRQFNAELAKISRQIRTAEKANDTARVASLRNTQAAIREQVNTVQASATAMRRAMEVTGGGPGGPAFGISRGTLMVGGEAIKVGMAMHTLATGFKVATAAVAAFRGDADKLREIMFSLPLGIGSAIQAIDTFGQEVSGTRQKIEKTKEALADFERAATSFRKIEEIRKGIAGGIFDVFGGGTPQAAALKEYQGTMERIAEAEQEALENYRRWVDLAPSFKAAREEAEKLYRIRILAVRQESELANFAERVRANFDAMGERARTAAEAQASFTKAAEAETKRLMDENIGLAEARIKATRDGYDKELELLRLKHSQEFAEYLQAGRDVTILLQRQAWERYGLQREATARALKEQAAAFVTTVTGSFSPFANWGAGGSGTAAERTASGVAELVRYNRIIADAARRGPPVFQ